MNDKWSLKMIWQFKFSFFKIEKDGEPSRDGSGILFCLVARRDKKDRADSATGGLRLLKWWSFLFYTAKKIPIQMNESGFLWV